MDKQKLDNLESQKEYHIKLVALNSSGGIIFENEITFTTK